MLFVGGRTGGSSSGARVFRGARAPGSCATQSGHPARLGQAQQTHSTEDQAWPPVHYLPQESTAGRVIHV